MASKRAAVKIEGFDEVLRALNRATPEVNQRLRKSSFDIADEIASGLRGWGGTAQAAPLLDRIRARNDRIPTLAVGSNAKSGLSGGATVNQLMGANFGTSGRHSQFPNRVKPDHYVYALIEHRKEWITRTWVDAVTTALATIDPDVKRR